MYRAAALINTDIGKGAKHNDSNYGFRAVQCKSTYFCSISFSVTFSEQKAWQEDGAPLSVNRSRILGRNWDKCLKSFPPAIHSHLY